MKLGKSNSTNWEYMIWVAMYGNGATIGTAGLIIVTAPEITHGGPIRALPVCYVAGARAMTPASARWLFATTPIPTLAAAMAYVASAWCSHSLKGICSAMPFEPSQRNKMKFHGLNMSLPKRSEGRTTKRQTNGGLGQRPNDFINAFELIYNIFTTT